MKYFLFGLLLLNTSGSFAETKGCLRALGNKFLVDVNCECLKNKTCAPMAELKYSAKFYEIRDDVKNKAVFTQNEKAKMKETYDLYNQIIKLQSSGKSKSAEIKELYVKLDKINTEVRSSYLKTKPEIMKVAQNEHKEMLNERKLRKAKIQKRASDFLATKIVPPLVGSSPSQEASETTTKKQESLAQQVQTLTLPDRAGSYALYKDINAQSAKKEENEYILRNLRPKELKRDEEDSLFEIITKVYLRSAYPVLLKED